MALAIPLLILIALSALFAILADVSSNKKRLYIFKPLTTILIIALALLSLVGTPPDFRFLVPMLLALLFSLGGDVSLMFDGEKTFLLGLVSFLIAHIIYSLAFVAITPMAMSDLFPAILLLVIAAAVYVFLLPGLGSMKIPVLVYSLIIIFMLSRALALLLRGQIDLVPALLVLVGSTLFYISDMILAIDKFRFKIRKNGWYILSTYFVAQALLALSLHYL